MHPTALSRRSRRPIWQPEMIAEHIVRPAAAQRTTQIRPLAHRADNHFLIAGLLLSDVVALVLATSATAALRIILEQFLPVTALGYPERHVFASVLVVPVLLVLFVVHGLYDLDKILVGSREYARICNAVTYGVLIVLVISFFAGEGPLVSRSWLVLLWLTTFLFVALARFAARRVVRSVRRRGLLRTRVVIVGASDFGVSFARQMRTACHEGIDVVGFLDEFIPIGQRLVDDVAVIGRPGDLVSGRITRPVDEYLLIPQALPHERLTEITRLMLTRNAPTVRMAVSSSDLLTHDLVIAERASVPLVTIKRARITGIDAILKRGLDLIGASLALLVLGPVSLAMWVRGRRGLVKQAVRGVCGVPTSFVVFGDEATGPLLRGAPALIAVLSGKLSLVGPRPVSVGARVPTTTDLGLAAVKPGLTGPWRLSGPEASLADQAVRDLAYVRDYTIWEDLRIIAQSLLGLLQSAPRARLARWQDTAA